MAIALGPVARQDVAMTAAMPPIGAVPGEGVPLVRLLVAFVVFPLLVATGVAAVGIGLQDRLPDPLATHWGFDGQPNGSMSTSGFVTFVALVTLALWVLAALFVLAARRSPVRFRVERAAMAAVDAVAAFFGCLTVLTFLVNADETARTAELPALLLVPVLAVAAVAGMAGFALAGRPPNRPPAGAPAAGHAVVARTLAPGERPVWQATLTSRLLVGTAAVAAVAGALLAWQVAWWVGLVLLVVAVVCLAVSSAHVTVDAHGLTVGLGPFGWPRKHVAPGAIASVTSEEIQPLVWGGWGYRVAAGRSAVVLRKGPGIVVDLRDGHRFAVTIGDADTGAALLAAYAHLAAPASRPTSNDLGPPKEVGPHGPDSGG
jgi:hypothetical protein